MLKPEIRIIAWDDCAFSFRSKSVRIVGVVYRGGSFIDGLLSTTIEKDGMDATEKITKSILQSRHYDQLSYIMLDGISYAGFNLVDIKGLSKNTKLPVVAVMRNKPDIAAFKNGLKNLDEYEKRLATVKKAGRIHSYNDIFYQMHGISKSECEELLKLTCIRSNIPEPLRVAHLIASGLTEKTHDTPTPAQDDFVVKQDASYSSASFSFGESRGRA